jgi:hypothetical protein
MNLANHCFRTAIETRSLPHPHPEVRAPKGRASKGEGVGQFMLWFWHKMAAPRQVWQPFMVQGDQGLLFSPRPSLDLPLARNRIGHKIVSPGKHQFNRPSPGRIAGFTWQIVMLPYTSLNRLLRQSGVIAAIRTAQNINSCLDNPAPRPSRLAFALLMLAPQDEGQDRAPRLTCKMVTL